MGSMCWLAAIRELPPVEGRWLVKLSQLAQSGPVRYSMLPIGLWWTKQIY